MLLDRKHTTDLWFLFEYQEIYWSLNNFHGTYVDESKEALKLSLKHIKPTEYAAQNFFGAVAVTSAFLPALKRTALRRPRAQRPVVAVVNSFASRIPLPSMAAYSASKAALASWADAIRPELAKSDIHVAQIQPGALNSPALGLAHQLLRCSYCAESMVW